jgi:hypothetical protein
MSQNAPLQDDLSNWQATGPGPHLHTVDGAGYQARFSAEAVESLGAKWNEIEITKHGAVPPLNEWAEQIATNARGLREPLKVIEVDGNENVATLRSAEPTVRGTVAEYYEVKLEEGNSATVNRYQADRETGTPRTSVPFALTHEATAGLVDAIVGE